MRIYSFSLRQGFNFSKSNFEPKQWEGPGNNRNDKGCQVVVKLEKSKFVSGLSKINESKLHLINHRQMIPAREHLLFPAFYKEYKSNHLHCQTIDVSVYNNAIDWGMCLM